MNHYEPSFSLLIMVDTVALGCIPNSTADIFFQSAMSLMNYKRVHRRLGSECPSGMHVRSGWHRCEVLGTDLGHGLSDDEMGYKTHPITGAGDKS